MFVAQLHHPEQGEVPEVILEALVLLRIRPKYLDFREVALSRLLNQLVLFLDFPDLESHLEAVDLAQDPLQAPPDSGVDPEATA